MTQRKQLCDDCVESYQVHFERTVLHHPIRTDVDGDHFRKWRDSPAGKRALHNYAANCHFAHDLTKR